MRTHPFQPSPLTAALAAALVAMPAQAVTNTWFCASAQWQNSGCWTAGVPQASHDVVVQPNPTNHTVVTLNAATGTANANTLLINATGAPTIRLDMTGGTLNVATYEYVATNGKASFTQSAGNHSVGNILFVGELAGGNGSYTLSSTGSLWADALFAGSGGIGSFNQSGSSGFSVGNELRLGNLAGGQGSYTQTGGALAVGNNSLVGVSGTGSFSQSAGTHSVASGLYLGYNSGGGGTYTLSGSGQLNTLFSVIGRQGGGTFTQNGGGHAITGELVLGEVAGGNGAYNLNGGNLNAGWANVGRAGGSSGGFSQGAGGFTIAGDLKVGTDAGSNGSFTLGGTGSVSSARTDVGYLGTGSFAQSAGSHTAAGQLYVGTGGGSNGTYNLTGGTLSVGTTTLVGHFGSGGFSQSAGTHTASGGLYLGTQASGKGSYALSGTGMLNTSLTVVADKGTGTFAQTGGTHTATGEFAVGAQAGSSGAYTLNGGVLNVGGYAYIGRDGAGSFSQLAGTTTVTGNLITATNGGSGGSFELKGGALNVNRDTVVAQSGYVGSPGVGSFSQSGGNHAVAGVLYVGTWANAVGTYNLSAGGLTAHDASIGHSWGYGTFNHSGGSNAVAGGFYLGYHTGGEGYYNLSGSGSLNTWNVFVGREGKGEFKQTGGTHTVTGTLTIATLPGSTGLYDIDGGVLDANAIVLNEGGTFTQAGGTVDFVTFNQTGGTNRVDGSANWYVGRAPNANGGYTLSGGLLDVRDEYVGYDATGTFNQSGGTHNLVHSTPLVGVTHAGNLYLGFNAASHGDYVLSNGVLDMGTLVVGEYGSGSFVQSGGAVRAISESVPLSNDGLVRVGRRGGTGSGVYTLTGGTLEARSLLVGEAGTGSFAQHAGSVTVAGYMLGSEPGGSGSYTLTAGTLSASGGAWYRSIGHEGHGAFIHTGGSHTADDMSIGFNTGAVGSYELSGAGMLTVGADLSVGVYGSGSFIQQAGSVMVGGIGGSLMVGSNSGSNGLFDLRGGTLTAPFTIVGGYGAGSFLHDGGAHSVGGDLSIGLYGHGSYVLSGTGVLNVGRDLLIGKSGSGRFMHRGGTHNIVGHLSLGQQAGGEGDYFLYAGNLSVGGDVRLGENGDDQTWQRFRLADDGATVSIAGNLIIAVQPGSNATFSLEDGVLNVPAVQLNAGGTFDMTGGTLNTLNFAQQGGTVTGTLRLAGTLEYHSGAFAGRLINDGTVILHTADFTAGNGLENNGVFPVIGAGRTVTLNGAGLVNNSFLELAGGTLGGGGPLVNNALITGHGSVAGGGGLVNNALITQSGGNLILANSGANQNAGNLDLQAGRQLQLAGATLANTGTLALSGASITGTGTLTNAAGGTLAGRGTVSANFSNAGTVLVENGNTRIVAAFANGGLIRLTSDGASLTGGAITNTGSLRGAGQVGNAIANSGTVEASGGLLTLGGGLTNTAAGTLSAPAGATLLVSQGLSSNAGTINLAGGVFDNNGKPLVNPGQIKGYGRLRSGGLTNDGLVGLSFGLSDISGAVTNTASGKIIVSGGAAGNATFYDRVINNGELRVSTGSRAVFFGLVSGTGSFTGGGAKQYEGGLSLGASPALVSMEGEVEIVGKQVVMELAGPTPGNGANNHDKTVFAGPVTLSDAPDLVVVLLAGYRPAAGARFDLFDWDGGVTGEFDLVLPIGYQWDTTALYSSGEIGVAAAVPEPQTWATLLAGLGMLGWAAARRKARGV